MEYLYPLPIVLREGAIVVIAMSVIVRPIYRSIGLVIVVTGSVQWLSSALTHQRDIATLRRVNRDSVCTCTWKPLLCIHRGVFLIIGMHFTSSYTREKVYTRKEGQSAESEGGV